MSELYTQYQTMSRTVSTVFERFLELVKITFPDPVPRPENRGTNQAARRSNPACCGRSMALATIRRMLGTLFSLPSPETNTARRGAILHTGRIEPNRQPLRARIDVRSPRVSVGSVCNRCISSHGPFFCEKPSEHSSDNAFNVLVRCAFSEPLHDNSEPCYRVLIAVPVVDNSDWCCWHAKIPPVYRNR
jgi:hypothetical protein